MDTYCGQHRDTAKYFTSFRQVIIFSQDINKLRNRKLKGHRLSGFLGDRQHTELSKFIFSLGKGGRRPGLETGCQSPEFLLPRMEFRGQGGGVWLFLRVGCIARGG